MALSSVFLNAEQMYGKLENCEVFDDLSGAREGKKSVGGGGG